MAAYNVNSLSHTSAVQQTTSTAVSNRYVVVTNRSFKNVDVGKNFALRDVTNKLLLNKVQPSQQNYSTAVLKSPVVTNTTLTKTTHSSSDNQSIPPVFRSNGLSAEYIHRQNLPKIIVHQNVSNPSVDGSITLRKIPNRQKSLSLQKNKVLALAIKSNEGNTAPSQPKEVSKRRVHKDKSFLAYELLTPETIYFLQVSSDIPVTATTQFLSKLPLAESSLSNTSANFQEILENMLSPKYSHHITEIEPIKVYHTKDYDESLMFMAVIRVNLRSKDEALEWLTDFTVNTSTDWRVRRVFAENTKCIIFRKGYRCQNNTMAQYRRGHVTAHEKNTECAASLMVTVKNFNMTRSKDLLLEKYPCEIVMHHCHNHPLEAAANLKHRRPSDEVRHKFEELFRSGFSPSAALHTHQYDLQMRSGDDFFKVLADGLECPNLQWCYNLYRNIFNQAYGAPTGEGMLASLKAAVHKYNEECGSTCAVVNVVEETEIVVALCTPLMKLVHQLKSSSEMAFLDAGGMRDRQNNRVFTLLAHSAAGALPEGMIITSSESENAIYEGLKMLISIVPPGAFGGRGIRGPQVIMTDDQTSERNALQLIFPHVVLLLCLFHVLQAMYIWDSKHKVDTSDKLEVYNLFRGVTYELNEDEFKKKYECMLSHSIISKNSLLQKHLKDLYDRAPEWALCFRNDLLTRGNNTNNYSEATVRQLKDQVLRRLTAYSEVQLFEFFTTRLDAYFERRLAKVLNGRQENYYKSKHFVHPSKLVPLQCEKTSQEGFYLVKNAEHKTEYVVDMEHEVCSCPVGRNGAPCKHQMAVVQSFNISSTQFLPVDIESKLALHKVMTTVPPPAEWYSSLKEGTFVPNSSAASDNYLETSANNNESDENLPLNEPTAALWFVVVDVVNGFMANVSVFWKNKDNSFIPSNGVDSNGVSVCQSHEVVQVAVENGRDGEYGGINLEEETETASKREEAKYEKVDVPVISLTLDSEVENGMNNRNDKVRLRGPALKGIHKYVDDDDDFDSTPKRIYASQGLEW
ncbi:Protein FAR1-RELATED SEQUENCE 2 [Frankliniella fusca]|uniref:Protein FAR1-RELATED SEQUENCE 2 n=1 Tax=Frankliniella fusca TaxID=407009 RepID=A0AAE1HHR6_9NEOP|nr:Protein FAR1-RELATED SEQUENCE 2 [Frankliniella fusca]